MQKILYNSYDFDVVLDSDSKYKDHKKFFVLRRLEQTINNNGKDEKLEQAFDGIFEFLVKKGININLNEDDIRKIDPYGEEEWN